ncbi:hypothetical protein FJY90_07315, partial [Candidatus Gottesmanbacteria bacterium]|nr:hypothetical protein [Candidatus Gottesmanbacteria bacterium]
FGDFDVAKQSKDNIQSEIEDKKRVLWADLLKMDCPPNIIVKTKNGLQPLWLLTETPIDPETQQQYKDTIRGLIDWSVKHGCYGDKVFDIARVLRVPGFYHQKADPYLIEAYQYHDRRYPLQDLHQKYPFFDYSIIESDNATVYREIGSLDHLTMREIAEAALKVYDPNSHFDNKGRIVLSRGVTGGYLGKKNDREYIGSNSHEIPAGNKITFVRKLLKLNDNKEAYKWIADRFNLRPEIKIIPPKPLGERQEPSSNSEQIGTGFPIFDTKIKNFRTSNTYLVAGLEKCGKSSFLMTMVNHWLSKNIKCAYINTELDDEEFKNRMAANKFKTAFFEVEKQPELKMKWWESNKDNFLYTGINDLVDSRYALSFEASLKHAENFVQQGAKIFCFDNLSTYYTQVSGKGSDRQGWEILANAIIRIVNFSKQNRVISFIVVHTKEGKVFSETPEGIRKIMTQGNPEDIFKNSITVVGKPNLSDVYGGGVAHSQISGALLVWTPFQKYQSSKDRGKSMIIIDTFRHAPYGEVRMNFVGEQYRFEEEVIEEAEQIKNWNNY